MAHSRIAEVRRNDQNNYKNEPSSVSIRYSNIHREFDCFVFVSTKGNREYASLRVHRSSAYQYSIGFIIRRLSLQNRGKTQHVQELTRSHPFSIQESWGARPFLRYATSKAQRFV